jgi:predicted nucleic acid-binding protein
MKYVLDSAVALKWVLPEIHADKAKRLRDGFENQIHELIAPDVFPVEASHALVRAERKKIIPIGQAAALLVDVMNSAGRIEPSALSTSKPITGKQAEV